MRTPEEQYVSYLIHPCHANPDPEPIGHIESSRDCFPDLSIGKAPKTFMSSLAKLTQDYIRISRALDSNYLLRSLVTSVLGMRTETGP